jgi:hypothetical protein
VACSIALVTAVTTVVTGPEWLDRGGVDTDDAGGG